MAQSDREKQVNPATTMASTSVNLNTQNFAGRIGGNQQFTEPQDGVPAEADAVIFASWRNLLDPRGFRNIELWKVAVIEGVATGLQVFLSGLFAVGIVPTATETSLGAVTPVTYAALIQIFLVSIFIYAGSPLTGAHFNPLITLSTFCAGLCSLPRAVLYILFQCAGGVVGAFIMRGCLGVAPSALRVLPGCYVDPTLVTPGQAFGFETMIAFVNVFLAFGLGLDPRNATTFGPALPPLLIGLSSAVTLFAGGIAREGYLGASANPARCLGLMAAADRFDYHYIHWTGDIAAAVINGILYFVIPPYVRSSHL